MTAEALLSVARAEIGVREDPAGSNRTKYGVWYGLNGQPWCVMFVQWCFDRAGDRTLLPARTASCGALMRAAQTAGQWVVKDLRPGDVVIYDFPGGAATDHCGIVERVDGGTVVAIEGNTSVSGSQDNGGMVWRKIRDLSLVTGAVRPAFDAASGPDNEASPAHQTGVEWAVENGILRGNSDGDLMLHGSLTREQFCTMLMRYHDMRDGG